MWVDTVWIYLSFAFYYVSLVVGEKCYSCLHVEGQREDSTLTIMTREAFESVGLPAEQFEAQLNQAMEAYSGMGFDLNLPFRKSCQDPFKNSSILATCESKGECGKIFSDGDGVATIWRGCPKTCTYSNKDKVAVSCCQGDRCNTATKIMTSPRKIVTVVVLLMLLVNYLPNADFY